MRNLPGLASLLLTVLVVVSCKKDEDPKLPPTVTTGAVSNITFSGATISGEITKDGNAPVTSSGFVYSKVVSQPTLLDEKIESGVSTGAFSVTLSKLSSQTTYNVRAFATNSVGTTYGTAVSFMTAVETVTFTYNGSTVVYGVINSQKTGKQWLDRNLGATSVATGIDDYRNYGDLFQWGRRADGHQLIVRTNVNNVVATPVNGMTATTSSSDNPGHALFIYNETDPFDWRVPQNNNLWQGVNGTNNPCPSGWRVPTSEELFAENITDIVDGYSKLKLTFTGRRNATSTTPLMVANPRNGFYWTTTLSTSNNIFARGVYFDEAGTDPAVVANRGNGYAVRCVRD
jgi:hypothetical protein